MHHLFIFLLCMFFPFLFHLFFFSISDTNYWHLSCLNYTSLLGTSSHTIYHTFPFHLLFSLCPILIIGIFYCLNYTSLLLDLIITHLVIHFITVINITISVLFFFYIANISYIHDLSVNRIVYFFIFID